MENDSDSQTSPSWPTRWPKGSFSIGWVLLVAGIVLGLFFAAAIVFDVWLYATGHYAQFVAQARNPATMSGPIFVASSTMQIAWEAVIVLIVWAALPRITRFSRAQLGFRPIDGRALTYGLLGALGMIVVADIGASVLDTFTHAVHPQLVERMFENLRASPSMVAFFVFFAVVAQPIAEETIFRLFVFNVGLRYGGFWLGAILSGALFGAAHTIGGGADPASGALLALGGIVLCWVYYRSRNAYASMISHALFNAVSTAVLYFFPKLAGG